MILFGNHKHYVWYNQSYKGFQSMRSVKLATLYSQLGCSFGCLIVLFQQNELACMQIAATTSTCGLARKCGAGATTKYKLHICARLVPQDNDQLVCLCQLFMCAHFVLNCIRGYRCRLCAVLRRVFVVFLFLFVSKLWCSACDFICAAADASHAHLALFSRYELTTTLFAANHLFSIGHLLVHIRSER